MRIGRRRSAPKYRSSERPPSSPSRPLASRRGSPARLRSRRCVHVPLRYTLPCSWDGRWRPAGVRADRAREARHGARRAPSRPTNNCGHVGGANAWPIATVATTSARAPDTVKDASLIFPQVSPRRPSRRYVRVAGFRALAMVVSIAAASSLSASSEARSTGNACPMSQSSIGQAFPVERASDETRKGSTPLRSTPFMPEARNPGPGQRILRDGLRGDTWVGDESSRLSPYPALLRS